jgi:hypothetical protein
MLLSVAFGYLLPLASYIWVDKPIAPKLPCIQVNPGDAGSAENTTVQGLLPWPASDQAQITLPPAGGSVSVGQPKVDAAGPVSGMDCEHTAICNSVRLSASPKRWHTARHTLLECCSTHCTQLPTLGCFVTSHCAGVLLGPARQQQHHPGPGGPSAAGNNQRLLSIKSFQVS